MITDGWKPPKSLAGDLMRLLNVETGDRVTRVTVDATEGVEIERMKTDEQGVPVLPPDRSDVERITQKFAWSDLT